MRWAFLPFGDIFVVQSGLGHRNLLPGYVTSISTEAVSDLDIGPQRLPHEVSVITKAKVSSLSIVLVK